MKYTGEEAKQIIGKMRSGETPTDTEKEYLVQATKIAIEELSDRQVFDTYNFVRTMSAGGEQELIAIVWERLFEDGS